MKKITRTLSGKITASVLVVTFLFMIVISIIVSYYFNSITLKNIKEATEVNQNVIIQNIDAEFEQIETMINRTLINYEVSNLLIVDNSTKKYNNLIMDLINDFNDILFSSVMSDEFDKIIISGYNGVNLQLGNTYGSEEDIQRCNELEWMQQLLDEPDIKWTGVVKNEFSYKNSEYIIPFVRPIYSNIKKRNVGWIFVGLNTHVVNKYLENMEDSEVYIFNSEGMIIGAAQENRVGQKLEYFDAIKESLLEEENQVINFRFEGEDKTAVYRKSNTTGWYILQTIALNQNKQTNRSLFKVIFVIALFLALLASLIIIIIKHNVSKPIKKLIKRIRLISKGDFSTDKTLESDDEIGEVGKVVNIMSENIVIYMDKVVSDEKTKKELEMKVLQTQVNPHFLYNTLNSIKWMATIQKTSGISEMITALSRLLRNMAKGISNEITIDEELDLLENYIMIQKHRYSDSFRVNIEVSEEIRKCKIIKFTIQPLVENAIFHGLEPKKGFGEIKISAEFIDDGIIIVVFDDGIGMTKEQIEVALSNNREHSKEGLNNIGVSNVKERIQLAYGNKYGIDIESQVGEYTKSMIIIPIIGA